MLCKLVIEDWRKIGESGSIYNTPLGVELSTGDMHSGTTFSAVVILEPNVEYEIQDAFVKHGAYPVFRFIPDIKKETKGEQ